MTFSYFLGLFLGFLVFDFFVLDFLGLFFNFLGTFWGHFF